MNFEDLEDLDELEDLNELEDLDDIINFEDLEELKLKQIEENEKFVERNKKLKELYEKYKEELKIKDSYYQNLYNKFGYLLDYDYEDYNIEINKIKNDKTREDIFFLEKYLISWERLLNKLEYYEKRDIQKNIKKQEELIENNFNNLFFNDFNDFTNNIFINDNNITIVKNDNSIINDNSINNDNNIKIVENNIIKLENEYDLYLSNLENEHNLNLINLENEHKLYLINLEKKVILERKNEIEKKFDYIFNTLNKETKYFLKLFSIDKESIDKYIQDEKKLIMIIRKSDKNIRNDIKENEIIKNQREYLNQKIPDNEIFHVPLLKKSTEEEREFIKMFLNPKNVRDVNGNYVNPKFLWNQLNKVFGDNNWYIEVYYFEIRDIIESNNEFSSYSSLTLKFSLKYNNNVIQNLSGTGSGIGINKNKDISITYSIIHSLLNAFQKGCIQIGKLFKPY